MLDNLVLWAKDVDKSMIETVGGKAANLGEMYRNDIPVPESFFVTSDAYKLFLEQNNLWPKIDEILQKINYQSPDSIALASKKIEELIINNPMPVKLKKLIIHNYSLLDYDHSLRISGASDLLKSMAPNVFVAVRSSATAEDLPEASFAGQQATYLNVKGNDSLIKSVQACWASLFTPRAIYYRHKNNFDHQKVFIAVVIQKMVDSVASGIIFTNNPSNNDSSEIVIEAGLGLGETIVSGSINPDTFIVNDGDFKIKSKKIGDQEYALYRNSSGGNIKQSLTSDQKSTQKISDDRVEALAEIAKRIEHHYGKPQDIEFAIDKKQIYIVQSRAITTLSKTSSKHEVSNAQIILEGLAASPGVVSGKVVLVHSMHDLDLVQKGDILVTKMTTPDMVPAMEKSAGIITNEGGMTCHAAIVSRELGVPSVVGTKTAMDVLKAGDIVTVDGDLGCVYSGEIAINSKYDDLSISESSKVADNENNSNDIYDEFKDYFTKIKLILDLPSRAEELSQLDTQGVGLVRAEFMISQKGVHPIHYLADDAQNYILTIYDGLEKIAKAFHPRPVWFRTSDLRSDEYRGLVDGNKISDEDNPMLGNHGIRFSLAHPTLLKAEFFAVKKLHDAGFDNIGVMLPFLITVKEFENAKLIAKEVGLELKKLGIMCETPASVWIMEDLIKAGIKFISFGTNDLTQLTLGIDRNNEEIASMFSELHPAVIGQVKKVIEVAKKYGVETSICGQAGSNPEMARTLVRLGINSISVNADAYQKIRSTLNEVEKEILVDSIKKMNQ